MSYAELLAGSPDFYTAWRKNKSAHDMPALEMAPFRRQAPAQPK